MKAGKTIIDTVALIWLAVSGCCILAEVSHAAPRETSEGGASTRLESGQQIRIDGVVTQRQKYSFTLQAAERDFEVFIPNATAVRLRLTRPVIDWEHRQLLITLPISAADGNADNNQVLRYPIPNRVFLTAEFSSAEQKRQVMAASDKRWAKYTLSAAPGRPADLPFYLQGELLPGKQPGAFQLRTAGGLHSCGLGPRHGKLEGFSILDLQPHVTEAFVIGGFDGEKVTAERIEFMHVGDPLPNENPDLPRCLFLGDSISFNYQRPLREALSGVVNLHHPPTNCGGSDNWTSIHRWLGSYRQPGRNWDVIAFNFGLQDDQLTKTEYQSNLRQAIDQLRKADAKLIWVTTTPIPFGMLDGAGTRQSPDERKALIESARALAPPQLVGHLPGRMAMQNRWAAEVLIDHPDIAVCDLWQVVEDGRSGDFSEWWFGKRPNFEYSHSVSLGRELARSILSSLGRDDSQLKPLDVHALKIAGPKNK